MPAPALPQASVVIDVWSDYVCPFCYLEQPVFERLRAEHGEAVQIRWHAFELRPDPVARPDPRGRYLHDIWARAVYPLAEQRGMQLRLPPMQPRSRKAMEAAEFARDAGRFEAMHDALFRAFFQDGADLDDDAVLVEAGARIGLDRAALQRALDDGRYTERVRQEQREAQALGISGVPLMVVRQHDQPLHDGLALSGAQPHAAVAAAVRRAMAPQ